MKIKILGSGCNNCIKQEANLEIALKELNLSAEIEKISDIAQILNYGIMSTPAIIIDEQIMSYGRVLAVNEIKELLLEPKEDHHHHGNGHCGCGGSC